MLSIFKKLFCNHIWEEDTYCLDHEQANVKCFVCKKCGRLVSLYTEDGCRENPFYDDVKMQYDKQQLEGRI